MSRKYRIILILLTGTVLVLLLLISLLPQADSASSSRGWRERIVDSYYNVKYALPWTRPPENCIVNLKQLDGAKATWALENKKTNSDIPTWADLYGPTNYIRDVPECPAGGKYTIGRVDQKPRCTIPYHTL